MIREETESDFESIRAVNVAAFTAAEFGYHGEADLVDRIRNESADCLSLVAERDDQVVGHIFLSPVVLSPVPLSDVADDSLGMAIAPMSVLPKYQRKGIGSALIRSALDRLRQRNCQFVVVLGHPDYYPKFGFEKAEDHGVIHGFDGIPQSCFFIRFLHRTDWAPVSRGRVRYHSAFGNQFDSRE